MDLLAIQEIVGDLMQAISRGEYDAVIDKCRESCLTGGRTEFILCSGVFGTLSLSMTDHIFGGSSICGQSFAPGF